MSPSSAPSTPRLVAIDLPGGPGFVDALERIWSHGNAAAPLDQRLPRATRAELARTLGVGDEVEPGDALVLATSGSTGPPKGVVHTHTALRAQAKAVHDRLDVDPTDDRWVACLPLAHVGGLGVVVRALITGTPLTVLPRFEPAHLDGTLVSLVPTALDRLDEHTAARFRWIVLGGSGDTTPRPGNVVHTYGTTETGGGVVYGNRALRGVEVRAVDGELQVRSASLLRCYRDGHDPKTADGWYATGDLGSVDAGGCVRVDGRRDDLIITGGENVWPESVEIALRGTRGVADVAVTGRPDPQWGHRVVAFVVPTESSDPPDLDRLRGMVKTTMPAYAAPRELVLVEYIPRTALGKIRRDALQ